MVVFRSIGVPAGRGLVMRRSLALVVLALLAVMAAPSVAWAEAPPPTEEEQPEFNEKFAAGEVCDFDLRIKSLQNDIVDKIFYDANGDPKRIVSKGKLIVKVVNLETGDWLVRNASGPVFVWINSDGSAHVSAPRRQIVLLFGGDEGGSGLLYIRGPYDNTWDVTPEGIFHNLDLNGVVTDLCAELS